MIPPFLARRPSVGTHPSTPPATGGEQVRQSIEAARLYRALDLRASVRDPFAAAWGADLLNREIALAVLTVGTSQQLVGQRFIVEFYPPGPTIDYLRLDFLY